MEAAETAGNQAQTWSDAEIAGALLRSVDSLIAASEAHGKQLDHMDEQIHEMVRVLDEHRPLLARAQALMDPGARVRAMLPHRKPKEGPDHG